MHHDMLDSMKNKLWLYKTIVHRILSYRMEKESCTIVTDRDWIVIPIPVLNKKLKEEFLPVAEDSHLPALTRTTKEVQGLTNHLLDTIKDIKDGKADYKKVNAINSTVRTMLSVFKTEAQLLQMKKEK